MDTQTDQQRQNVQQSEQDIPLFEWTAAVMPEYHRSVRWYMVAGGIVFVTTAISILMRAWSFTVVLILLTGVYFLVHRKPSPHKKLSLRTKTFVFDGEVIAWNDCGGFWMLQGPGYTELHIDRKEKNKKEVVIQTGELDPYYLRQLLLQYLPEYENRRERVLDTFARIIKI